jgi:hypothetical protein
MTLRFSRREVSVGQDESESAKERSCRNKKRSDVTLREVKRSELISYRYFVSVHNEFLETVVKSQGRYIIDGVVASTQTSQTSECTYSVDVVQLARVQRQASKCFKASPQIAY